MYANMPITLIWPYKNLSPAVVGSRGGGRCLAPQWIVDDLRAADLDSDDGVEALIEPFGSPLPPWPKEHQWLLPVERRQRRRARGAVDARWWLKTLRAMTNTWMYATAGGVDPTEAWAEEGLRVRAARFDIWSVFNTMLTSGVQVFAPRVVLEEPEVNVFEAGSQQLVDLMLSPNATPRRCANETCRRLFIYQRGEGIGKWRRSTGVLYDTPKCARAQAQREYRRRSRNPG